MVRSHEAADNSLINVEEKTHEEIEQIAKELHDDIANNGVTTETASKE